MTDYTNENYINENRAEAEDTEENYFYEEPLSQTPPPDCPQLGYNYDEYFPVTSAVVFYPNSEGDNVSNMPDNILAQEDTVVTIPSNIPTRTGYTFTYWNTRADGTGTFYAPGGNFTMPAADFSLFAIWAVTPPRSHTVSFFPNGQHVFGLPDTITAQVNQQVTVPGQIPVRKGFTFCGWIIGTETDTAIIPSQVLQPNQTLIMPAYDIFLYACWQKDSYAILFDSNDCGDKTTRCMPQSILDCAAWAEIPPNIPKRKGYSFDSWNTCPNGCGIAYYPCDCINTYGENITLYAKWVRCCRV